MTCSSLSTLTDQLHQILCYAWYHVGVRKAVANAVHAAKRVWTVQPCARLALVKTVPMHVNLMATTVTALVTVKNEMGS